VTLHVAVRFAYDGAAFASYARNPDAASVEAALISTLGKEGLVEGSFRSGSRTDAGVSALGNVCAATLNRPHLRGLVPSLQRHLPGGLWVTGAAQVPAAWNPRHATSRTYRLLHADGGEDLARMRQTAAAFVGTHDVRAFAKTEAGRSPERTVLAFAVASTAAGWSFRVRGQSFLWNQVRRMVGAILAVGRGEADVADIKASLASGKPHPRFGLAPAEGLLLERVAYRGLRWDAASGSPRIQPERLLAARSAWDVARHVASLG